MKIDCEIIANSDVEHLQQIYTGFSRLHREGHLNLRQTIAHFDRLDRNTPNRWSDYRYFNTTVVIDGEITVTYDMHDWNWIDEEILNRSDFYFKRSYDADYIASLDGSEKVFPLGLNFAVTSAERDPFKLKRATFYEGSAWLKAVLKGLRIDNYLSSRETERVDNLEAFPDFTCEPRVLFMARMWDPGKVESKSQRQAVEAINESRANCIALLRRELGDRFYGGVSHDEYSARHFPKALLTDAQSSNKRNYLDILKTFPICVATVGLNGSNGWKLAEYVAHSKAIITEPLVYQVSGDFEAGSNYLEFNDPHSLVESAVRLIEDPNLREAMMVNNFEYYHSQVRPDALVLNSLKLVLSNVNADVSARNELIVNR